MRYKIKSTSKERKRYLLVKIDYPKEISGREIENIIINACLKFLGELGFSKASILVLPESLRKNQIIVKVSHKYVDDVKTALMLIKESNSLPMRLSVIRISGTIAKLKKLQS
ncbi:MAG: Rpp14/Pop5 family protein [Candidatus Nanoarchaeia archaeon]